MRVHGELGSNARARATHVWDGWKATDNAEGRYESSNSALGRKQVSTYTSNNGNSASVWPRPHFKQIDTEMLIHAHDYIVPRHRLSRPMLIWKRAQHEAEPVSLKWAYWTEDNYKNKTRPNPAEQRLGRALVWNNLYFQIYNSGSRLLTTKYLIIL